ncbi:dual OB domain-containing protein [Gloeobacter morelensis]|uniref:dual OB domain-containing protein n=1 Tax=Gloeobacter morelensis TaxID=2907343 RepID=UPI003AB98484
MYSLSLVAPQQIQWSLKLSGSGNRQVRAHFELGDEPYALSVTDPSWERRFSRLVPDPVKLYSTEEVGYVPRAGHRLLLTVSLGQPFKGYCYKLVAAVFAVPEGIDTAPQT